jgi:hypothetical protein
MRTVLRLLLAASLLASLPAWANPEGREQIGRPLTGEPGVTETISEIMLRAASPYARAPRPRRIKIELGNEHRPFMDNHPDSPLTAAWPVAEALLPAGTTPTPVISTPAFTAATLVDTSSFPPDTMGAVGPSQYVVALNGRIRTFDKTTGVADGVLDVHTDLFFAAAMSPNAFTSDPRVRYDALSGRWFFIMIDVTLSGGANRTMIAVSDGPELTPDTVFTYYYFVMSPTLFTDYPTLGIDANALYIGANMFTLAFGWHGTHAAVVRKSSVLTGGPIVFTTFPLTTGSSPGLYTPIGVDNPDPSATEGWLVGVDNASFGLLVSRRVTDPAGTPTLSANLGVTVPTTNFPAPVPHLGNTGGNNGRLDSIDDRLYDAKIRNGRLWTAHQIRTSALGVPSTAAGSRNSIRWYELSISETPVLVQAGTVFDSAATNERWFWMPSIMVSGPGHVALGYSQAGPQLTPNAGLTGRLASFPAGTMADRQDLTTSTATYNPPSDPGGAAGRRWGDYSFTSLDPCDDMTMWTAQEFASETNIYGVHVARLLAPPPTVQDCAAPVQLVAGGAAATVSLNGSGFYQPPTGLGACRIPFSVDVTGVSTISEPEPGAFSTVDLLAVADGGAAIGPRSITLTNPDGQSTVAANCIEVIEPAAVVSLTAAEPDACVGDLVAWQAEFSLAVSGVSADNFELIGGTGANVVGVAGAGSERTVIVDSGTEAGALRLDLVHGTDILPPLVALPATGETIDILPLPVLFELVGQSHYCTGEIGSVLGLEGSETGVLYQLERDDVAIGAPVPGTGSALDFGPQPAGTYTVRATANDRCSIGMTGQIVVTERPAPTVIVSQPGPMCTGGTTSYTLDSNPTGADFSYIASGTGTAAGFADSTENPIQQTLTGGGNVTYSVVASLAGCAGPAFEIVQPLLDPTPSGALPFGVIGSPYSSILTAPFASSGTLFELASGTLPEGVQLGADGQIEGTPAAVGSFPFDVRGVEQELLDCTASAPFEITVRATGVFADGFDAQAR